MTSRAVTKGMRNADADGGEWPLEVNLLWFVAPALTLGLVAQLLVRAGYSRASRRSAQMSGYAAARHILDGAGLYDVGVEQVPGLLSDHYDPGPKVVRLCIDVYHGRNLAAVGIAAHEAGHALQHAQRYRPLAIRNAAVPAASFGSGAGLLLAVVGLIFRIPPFLLIGVLLFSAAVFFQLVNLPVEYNASRRAKRRLLDLEIVAPDDLPDLQRVLNAAALTYVAATLQSLLTLFYYAAAWVGGRSDD